MMDRNRLLLLCCLLTGVACVEEVFMYTRLGDGIVIPCAKLVSSDCSFISWFFYRSKGIQYTQLVNRGLVKAGSDKASRLSVTTNCSISLRQLQVNDAGSYVCKRDKEYFGDIYLSLLSITSPSTVTDLQPGGNLSLNCILYTYYDAGSCKYSSMLKLSWMDEDGMVLQTGSRYQLIGHSHCHVTLVTTLQREDNSRRWRCQVITEEDVRVFLDFMSIFLFEDPLSDQKKILPSSDCPTHLPITRILFCVTLPALVVIMWMLTWRRDRTRTPADW
ncbi:uncharacterized protein [Antennarius striatus]|uniref:uncharacterized protein n=1 Tax=Antennarius striatus TaxID=241820 RepID=UPI0035AD8E91